MSNAITEILRINTAMQAQLTRIEQTQLRIEKEIRRPKNRDLSRRGGKDAT
jgi:hypothetical protein